MVKDTVKELIDISRLNMSDFQIKNFIINDQITDYKKIKQCLLELRTRYEQFEDLMEDIELKKIDIEELEEQIENEENKFEIKRNKIKLKREKRKLNALNQSLNNLTNEIKSFEKIVETYINEFGIDKIKDMLVNQEEYEPDYWKNKFIRSATFNLISSGRITDSLLEAISNLNENEQAEILSKAFDNFVSLSETFRLIQEDAKLKLINKKEDE